ncbi:MAG: hypothetical protein ABI876_10870 [Bacteroidota bacterium]
MRKGCIIFTVLLVVLIAGAGFAGYHYLKNSLGISADLKAYANKDSVLGKLRSHAPAPGRNEHLTKQQVALFIGALDSAATGWRNLRAAIDSFRIGTGTGKDSSEMNISASPKLVRGIILAPLVTRRAIVNYLNNNNLSWEQYLWIKERTVAAADINAGDLDSAETAVARAHLHGKGPDIKGKLSRSDDFFRKVEQIRNNGLLNDHDRELAAPYRDLLLSRGLPTLMGTETNLTDKNGGFTFGPIGDD